MLKQDPQPNELLRGIPPVEAPNRRLVKLDKNRGCLTPSSLAFTEGSSDGSSVYSCCILIASKNPWIGIVEDADRAGIVGVALDDLPATTFHSHDQKADNGVEFAHCLIHGQSKFPSLTKPEARDIAKAAQWSSFPASMEQSLRQQGLLTLNHQLRVSGRQVMVDGI